MTLTTGELFAKVIAKRNWYKPAGIDRLLAAKTKENFKKGTLSDNKQSEILLKLGYVIVQERLWETQINNKCDLCGSDFNGESHPVYDENYNLQRGLLQCDECFQA